MKRFYWFRLIVAAGLMLGVAGGPLLAHGNHKSVCKKAGKVIKVKGKSVDEKKAACEAKGGTWEESED